MPSWIGPWEIAIVVIVALLIFGPSRLPGLGSSLGKSITGFKKGLKESQEEFQAALKDDAPASEFAEATTTSAPALSAKQPVMATTAKQPVVGAAVRQPVVATTAIESPVAEQS